MGHKHYAVKVGRGAPVICDNWGEVQGRTRGFPGNVHRAFGTREEAQAWLSLPVKNNTTASTMKRPRSPSPEPYAPVPGPSKSLHSQSQLKNPQVSSQPTFHPTSSQRGYATGPTYRGYDAGASQASQGAGTSQKRYGGRVEPPSDLSPEQRAVFDRVCNNGESLFYTGSAGTGKSHLLRALIAALRKSMGDKVAVTASTGIAGQQIGGSTIHSFAGIGLGNKAVPELVKEMYPSGRNRWTQVKVLILDEVSMLESVLFDKLEEIACIVRGNDRPFGGIQLVLTGDFFQLPPVTKGNRKEGTFAFDAKSWSRCIPDRQIVLLRQVFRQRDSTFVDLLNAMREGIVSDETAERMAKLSRPVTYGDGIAPTELYPLKTSVEQANAERLKKLPGPEQVYRAQDWGPPHVVGKNLIALPELKLRVGAQVMLIKNMASDRLVNGSRGVVERFVKRGEADKESLAVPEAAEERGAKRPRSQDGEDPAFPVVRFTNGAEMYLPDVEFTVEDSQGKELGARRQVPLILAWALSVHKSQGQTCDRVLVNLQKTFENGQVYVALSRATSLDALQVLHFDRNKVTADAGVKAWYEKLLGRQPQQPQTSRAALAPVVRQESTLSRPSPSPPSPDQHQRTWRPQAGQPSSNKLKSKVEIIDLCDSPPKKAGPMVIDLCDDDD